MGMFLTESPLEPFLDLVACLFVAIGLFDCWREGVRD